MTICGIYKIENLITHHIYIGQSVDIITRWRRHRDDAKNENKDYPLYRAIRKYGIENFSFEIIEECQREELNDKEKYWIQYFDSYKNGYNQTIGGQGALWSGASLTVEEVSLIREELKNTSKTNSIIANQFGVSENTICGINTGYYWKDDSIDYPIRKNGLSEKEKAEKKAKLVCSKCGKALARPSKTGLCQICASMTNRKVERPSKEELYSFLIINQGNFALAGRQYGVTDNSVRKWCKSYNLPYSSKDYRLSHEPKTEKKPPTPTKAVAKLDKETGEILATYHSIYEAERENNISHVGQVCNGKRKTTGGYKWKFI